MRKNLSVYTATILAVLMSACGPNKPDMPSESTPQSIPAPVTPKINYSLVAKHPHDTTSFTEGLLFHENKLFESTGATGYLPQTRSAFGVVDLQSGKFTVKAEL